MALFSYLVAFAYWLGLGLAGLVLLMIFHAAKAHWPIVIRRLLEVIAASLPPFAILFLPIVLGLKLLYPWAAPTGWRVGGSPAPTHRPVIVANLT